MKTILVTGATGLLAQALIPALLASGFKVYGGTRSLTKASKCLQSPNLTYVTYQHLPDDLDGLINLAGHNLFQGRWSQKQKQTLVASRVAFTQELAKQLPNPIPWVLSGSAVGIYGNRESMPLNEAAPKGEDFAAQLCQDWEQAAHSFNTERLVLLRTGIVLSRQGGALAPLLPLYKFALGARLASGQQYWSWIHVDDWVRAVLFLIQSDLAGAVNLTAPNPVTQGHFHRQLAKTLRRPNPWFVPAPLLKVLVGEGASLLLDSQRVLPEHLQRHGFHFTFADLESALRSLCHHESSHCLGT